MKKLFLFLTSTIFLLPSLKAQKTITVENTTSLQRSELVAVSADQLGIEVGRDIIVRDAFGIERTTQWTHDGQLLLPFMCVRTARLHSLWVMARLPLCSRLWAVLCTPAV